MCCIYSLIICRAFTHRKVLNLSIHGLSTFIVRNVRVHITSENQFTYLKIKFDKVFVERRINPFKRTRVSTGKKQSKKVIGVQRGEKSEKQVDSLFVSNQIFVSWRLLSIDWCSLGEESIFLMHSSVNWSRSFATSKICLRQMHLLPIPQIESGSRRTTAVSSCRDGYR